MPRRGDPQSLEHSRMSASGQSEQEPAVAQMIEVNGQSGEHDRVSIGCASDVRAKPKRLVLAGEPPHAASNHVNVGWSGISTASKPSSPPIARTRASGDSGWLAYPWSQARASNRRRHCSANSAICVVRRYGRRCTPGAGLFRCQSGHDPRHGECSTPGASTP